MRERRLRRLGFISGPSNTATSSTNPPTEADVSTIETAVNPVIVANVVLGSTTTNPMDRTFDVQKNKIGVDHEYDSGIVTTSKTSADTLEDDDGNERQLKHQKFDEDSDVTRRTKDTFLNNNEDAGILIFLFYKYILV